jgi:integrase
MRRNISNAYEKETNGKVRNLLIQLDKVSRCNNQNSIATGRRYDATMIRFSGHLGSNFNLQSLKNIQDKHLESYARELKERGLSDKYIKNELSAIRFYHTQMPDTRYKFTDSKEFNRDVAKLGSTPDGRADRAWTVREMTAMKDIAIKLDRSEIAKAMDAMSYTGGRLDEIATIKRHQVEAALRTGGLHMTNTKGGRPRTLPISDRLRDFLEKAIKDIDRGDYVFCPRDYVESHTIHKFEKAIEKFIGYHRDKVQDEDRHETAHNIDRGERAALTAHGLRHTYCRERVYNLMEQGLTRNEAKSIVSNEVGHDRESVIEIYLAEVFKK